MTPLGLWDKFLIKDIWKNLRYISVDFFIEFLKHSFIPEGHFVYQSFTRISRLVKFFEIQLWVS